MQQYREEVIKNIRACLISSKEQMTLSKLHKDYFYLIGEEIPFSKFHYKKLKDFILDIPTIEVTTGATGKVYLHALPTGEPETLPEFVEKTEDANDEIADKPAQITLKWRPNFSKNLEEAKAKKKGRKPASKRNIPSNKTITIPSKPMRKNVMYPSSPVNLETFAKSLLDPSLRKQQIQQQIRLRKSITNGETKPPPPLPPLERDSGNSSPTSDKCEIPIAVKTPTLKPPPPQPQQTVLEFEKQTLNAKPKTNSSEDPIVKLNQIAEKYKLGPVEFLISSMKSNKNKTTVYYCSVAVDNESYLSYPKDFYDEKSAKEYCALKALEDLIPKCEKRKSLLFSSSKDVKERIPPMLKDHPQGIWSYQMESDYMDKHMELLPSNWLEIVDSSDCVAVQKILDKYLLKFCEPGTALQKNEEFNQTMELPTHQLDQPLHAKILCMLALNEIWVQLTDTDSFVEMSRNMRVFYEKNGALNSQPDGTIEEGLLCAVKHDCGYFRARIIDVEDSNTVGCFLLDTSEEISLDSSRIYTLKQEFATACPAQAFACRMAGLEEFYTNVNVPLHKLNYTGTEVVLDVLQQDEDGVLAVDMYNSSTGDLLNEELLQFSLNEMAALKLKPMTIQEVYVSHLSNDGALCVHARSNNNEYLEKRLRTHETTCERNAAKEFAVKIVELTRWKSENAVFLYKTETTWCRSKVLEVSAGTARLYLVDKGIFENIEVSKAKFSSLDKLNDVIIQRFPPQSVQVKMALDVREIPSNFAEIVKKSIDFDVPVLMKIVSGEHAEPVGKFYRRTLDGELLCVNESIAMEIEMKSKQNDTESEDAKLANITTKFASLKTKDHKGNVPSGGVLPCPEIPQPGKYFEVRIPFVVNPWNFFVQPYQSQKELNNLMDELQINYNGTKLAPLQINTIVPGQIYATKHSDGLWYRTSVLKVIHSGSISVFYCDFGYYSSLTIDQLFHLNTKFTTLPYQAIKAKLSGIKPKKNKWSMEDCEVFTSLVKNKSFVSVLMDVEKDELYESDSVLQLKLIDTSTDDDVFVEQELVRRNIAVRAT